MAGEGRASYTVHHMIISRIRWAAHVTRTGKELKNYKLFARKPIKYISHGRCRHNETGWKGWIGFKWQMEGTAAARIWVVRALLRDCQLVKDSGLVIPLYNGKRVQFQWTIQPTVNLKYARRSLAHRTPATYVVWHTLPNICNMKATSEDAAKGFQDEMETER
jgi:hypothetical protein